MDKCPTPEELQRIDRGEEDYADGDWEVCCACNGVGEFPSIPTWFNADTICPICKGKGEIEKEA
jgi:DnaJ-class molecular chaperone